MDFPKRGKKQSKTATPQRFHSTTFSTRLESTAKLEESSKCHNISSSANTEQINNLLTTEQKENKRHIFIHSPHENTWLSYCIKNILQFDDSRLLTSDSKIRVFWNDDLHWYCGKVTFIDKKNGIFSILYEDGEVEEIQMFTENKRSMVLRSLGIPIYCGKLEVLNSFYLLRNYSTASYREKGNDYSLTAYGYFRKIF